IVSSSAATTNWRTYGAILSKTARTRRPSKHLGRMARTNDDREHELRRADFGETLIRFPPLDVSTLQRSIRLTRFCFHGTKEKDEPPEARKGEIVRHVPRSSPYPVLCCCPDRNPNSRSRGVRHVRSQGKEGAVMVCAIRGISRFLGRLFLGVTFVT